MKIDTDVKANRLYCPQLVGLVTTLDSNGKPNIATFAWITSVSFDPEMIAICLSSKRYTYECIKYSREFVINLPTVGILKEVWFCGTHSGRDVDKFKETGLTPINSKQLNAPRVKECIAHLECRLTKSSEIGDHIALVGKVVAKSCDSGAIVDGTLDPTVVKPVFHLGGSKFTTAGKILDALKLV